MAETSTKNYSKDNFPELISDLQSAYKWNSVQISEDGSSVTFYVTKSIYFSFSMASNGALSGKIGKNKTDVVAFNASAYYLTRITKTTKAFCFSFTPNNASGVISPNSSVWNIIVGNAVNQFTNSEETALAVTYQNTSGFILSSDNLTESVSMTTFTSINQNLSSKITTMQNLFSKYSDCIMKDVYILTSLQFPQLSFNDCTFNGKKYYMQGCILLADD